MKNIKKIKPNKADFRIRKWEKKRRNECQFNLKDMARTYYGFSKFKY